jgi:hypothetical protein
MEKIFKIVKKFLLLQSYTENGFEYQFISVKLDDNIIDFTVNVVLPKKGQSFVVDVFSYDISNIITNMSKHFGEQIVYMEHILVDGRPAPKDGVYINPEDCDEIIRALNENIKYISVTNNGIHTDRFSVGSNISFTPQKRNEFYSMDSHQYINIYLIYNLSNIKIDGNPVELDMKMVNEFAEVYNEKLQDSDSFLTKLQDIIYRVLEPSLKIEDLEVYYNPFYWIGKVEGMETHADGNSFKTDFSEEMFKKISL